MWRWRGREISRNKMAREMETNFGIDRKIVIREGCQKNIPAVFVLCKMADFVRKGSVQLVKRSSVQFKQAAKEVQGLLIGKVN